MSRESKLKKILDKLFAGGDSKSHIDEKYVEISVPGFNGLVINLVPTGDSGNDLDFEMAGSKLYNAFQKNMPPGVSRVFIKYLASDLLSRTYTVEELRAMKKDIEEIGNEAIRNKTLGNLFGGRDLQTLEMYEILDYALNNRND